MGNSEKTFHAGIFFLSLHKLFFSLSLKVGNLTPPTLPTPSLSLYFFPLHSSPIGTKMLHSSNPLWIFKCRWVVQIVVSAASGADCENLPEFDSRGLFSFLIPPLPLPPPPSAQPCSLTAQDLFVFSHGTNVPDSGFINY